MFKIFRKKYDQAVLYKSVFSTDQGRLVLADLVSYHQILNSTYDDDARRHAFNEGQKESVRRILQILNVDFKEAEKLLEEHHKQENRYTKE